MRFSNKQLRACARTCVQLRNTAAVDTGHERMKYLRADAGQAQLLRDMAEVLEDCAEMIEEMDARDALR